MKAGAAVAAFCKFWYGFLVGDDWTVAAGVIAALAAAALFVHHGVPAWWVMPAAVTGLLVSSLRRATRGPS